MSLAALALLSAAVAGGGLAMVALGTNTFTRALGLGVVVAGAIGLCAFAPAVFP
jgi:hypothetical protein